MALGGGSAATVYVDVEGDLTQFKKDVGKAGDVAQKELGGKSSGFAKAGKFAGAAMAGGAIAALGAGLNQALEKEQLDLNLAASLGLDPDGEEARILGEQSASLYRDAWGDTLEDSSGAIEAAAAAFYTGLNGEVPIDNLEDYAAKAIAIGGVFEADSAEVIGAVNSIWSSGLSGGDIDNAFDALTAAAQAVPKDVRGELLAASNEYSQFFDALGFNAEEAFGLLSTQIGDGAFGIDKAGDAIKEFTIRATDGSTSTVEAFESIGLSAEDMQAALLAGGDTGKAAFDQITAALGEIEDPAAQAEAALALFGTPLEDLGVNDIPTFIRQLNFSGNALDDVEGSAQAVADTVGGSATASFESLKRKGMGILADFAEDVLLPALDAILPVLEGLVEVIELIPTPIKAAGFGALIFGGGLIALAGPILNATRLVSGFFTLLSANPYILILAATIALVIVIVKNWDTIVAFLQDAWEILKIGLSELKDFFVDIWNGIYENVAGILDSVWSKVTEIWGSIKGFLEDTLSSIGGFFTDYIINPVSAIIGFFKDLPENARTAWQGVKNAINDVYQWIKDKLGEIGAAADRALGPLDEIAGFVGGGIASVASVLPFVGATGGIVTRPTLAMIGEAGPEAVVPLNQAPGASPLGMGGAGGDTYNVILRDATIRNDDDVVRLARRLEEETRRVRRSKGVRA